MKLEKIIELKPQCTSIQYGAEPSLRQLIEKYYRQISPEDYKTYVEDYLTKLQELIKAESPDVAIKSGDVVRVVFDSKEGSPESFTSDGVSIGEIGIVGHIDDSDYPINVMFNNGNEVGFTVEELEKV